MLRTTVDVKTVLWAAIGTVLMGLGALMAWARWKSIAFALGGVATVLWIVALAYEAALRVRAAARWLFMRLKRE